MAADSYPVFKAAAVQAAPVFLDREATVEKACRLIEHAAERGAALVVFPEVFIPAYPLWSFVYTPLETHSFFHRLFCNSLRVPGPLTDKLCDAARRAGVYVSMGINEKTDVSMGAIWNTNVFIDRRGTILSRHRKLVPTWVEKLTWANGDAAGLRVVKTDIGQIGVSICGENTNPLARFSLLAQGEQVHISTYPPAFPSRPPGDAASFNLGDAIRIRSAAHSFEGKVFNIVAASVLDDRTIEEVCLGDEKRAEVLRKAPKPVSIVVNPNGELVGGPIEGEGMIIADVDINESIEWKQIHDVVGYYNRFDIFSLRLDQRPQRPIEVITGTPDVPEERQGDPERTGLG
ncbi:MAG: carbon-nitrogen hydrolase family protein [Candidatus Methylomirabilales bacterium]